MSRHHSVKRTHPSVLAASLLTLLFAGCGGGGDGPGGGGDCPEGQRLCDGVCVDLQTNTAHCGACSNACAAAESCEDGACSCRDGFTRCEDVCVDLGSDPDHCGACATVCATEQVCSSGSCGDGCAAGETECDRACVDLDTNVLHCGACDRACASGQSCAAGECTCGSGGRLCGGVCVNVATDPSNCGGCAVRCAEGETCRAGVCEAAPPIPPVVTASCTEGFTEAESCAATAAGTTYYVSTSGDDASDGLTEATPLRSLARASEIAAEPGDRILFRCGDLWRGETLTIERSGAECQHVVYGSYPAACADQPRFSGSFPIAGWERGEDGVWSADLTAGENAGRFPNGINQLFRGEQRLPLGRWPNLDDTASSGGYSRIDAHPSPTVVTDPRLPAGDWSHATFRYFSIRWLLLNREVTSSGDGTLTLGDGIECYDGCGSPDPGDASAFGWGYYLTHHRATLDQQDEWFYDAASGRVFLVSGAEPADIEGSAIPAGVTDARQPTNDEGFDALVLLGANMGAPIHHVVVENLRLENGWRNGIAYPINQVGGENENLTLRCNTIRNVDSKGILLATWVLDDPSDADGWTGGQQHSVLSNVIDGANHFGLLSVARDTTIQDNLISNTGLLENLGATGLGCAYDDDNCTENGDGIDLQRWDRNGAGSSNVTVRRNRVERSGYCGIDVFGVNMLLEENVVVDACYAKGDCGGFRLMEADDITVRRNVIRGVISPPDGFNSTYEERFGFGLYVDEYTTANCDANTIERTQGYGILYQGAETLGEVTGNTVYDVEGRTLVFAGFEGVISSLTDNVLVATRPMRLLFTEADGDVLASNRNYFIQPYGGGYINLQSTGDWEDRTLSQWQEVSGRDLDSVDAWFEVAPGAASPVELFVNDRAEEMTVGLDAAYLDLDQQAVVGSVVLAPFSSRVLVRQE